MQQQINSSIATFAKFGLIMVYEAPDLEGYIIEDLNRSAGHLAYLESNLHMFKSGLAQGWLGEDVSVSCNLQLDTLEKSEMTIRVQIGSTSEKYNTIIDIHNLAIAIDMQSRKVNIHKDIKPILKLSRICTDTYSEDPLDEVMEDVWEFQDDGQKILDLFFEQPNFSQNLGELVFTQNTRVT